MHDTYRHIEPNTRQFSRYYNIQSKSEGATRLNRIYISENLIPTFAKYNPIVKSNHLSFKVKLNINEDLYKLLASKPKISFKIKPKVIENKEFQEKLQKNLTIGKVYKLNIIII